MTISEYQRQIAKLTAERDHLRALLDEAATVEHERDAYRSMLCDLLGTASAGRDMHTMWNRTRDLLKNGPAIPAAGKPSIAEQRAAHGFPPLTEERRRENLAASLEDIPAAGKEGL